MTMFSPLVFNSKVKLSRYLHAGDKGGCIASTHS
jgi:hypothetical protein